MNTRISAIVVDDEKNSREVLIKLLAKRHPEIHIVGEAADVEEAYELCSNLKPQLVFLDIQMPKANGFNLLKKFDKIPFEVIFVTSYDQYAITAIKFNALDYLLKPVELSELQQAILKVRNNIESKTNQQPQVINLIHSLESDLQDKKFAVHSGEKVKIINGNDIVVIKGDGRYCHLIMNSNETLIMTRNLKDFEDYFGVKSGFIRISKTYMINAAYIREYSKGDPFIITLTDNQSFEVSRRKKPEVLTRLKVNS